MESSHAAFGFACIALLLCSAASTRAPVAHALGEPKYVSTPLARGDFALVANGQIAPLVVSEADWPGVIRAVGDLGEDVGRVTGHDAPVVTGDGISGINVVLIGTTGRRGPHPELCSGKTFALRNFSGRWPADSRRCPQLPKRLGTGCKRWGAPRCASSEPRTGRLSHAAYLGG